MELKVLTPSARVWWKGKEKIDALALALRVLASLQRARGFSKRQKKKKGTTTSENSPVKEEHAWAHSTAASPERIHRIPPLASEVSREITRGEATRGGGKGEPATISYKFSFLLRPHDG